MTARSPWTDRLPNDPTRERWAISLVLVLGLASMVGGSSSGAIGLILTLGFFASVLVALVYVRRIPRLVVAGALGGAAGGLALGAGLRLAMRIVSLTGARREITIEGTMFLLIAGVMFGAMLGGWLAAIQRAYRPRTWVTAAGVAALFMSVLLLDSEFGQELLHEGAGGWLNIPMFAGVFFLYGVLALRATAAIDARLPMTPGRPLQPAEAAVRVSSGA